MFWEAKRKQLRELMELHHQAPQRQRRKSSRDSMCSENEDRNLNRLHNHRKSPRDSSVSDDSSATEGAKHPKKQNRSRKSSENQPANM